jgi:uncharacterized cupredoxin-like copper-binding protein
VPNTKVQTITLTTQVTQLGEECVSRNPSQLTANRASVDVVRLLNGNPTGSGKTIKVKTRPADHLDLIFSPVPAANVNLQPGESVDWTVKNSIAGLAGMKFETDPDNCSGHNQDDIIISC